ncbi:MAG: methyltransferase domain-containing protein [Bacteroidetes bacterium]|nr:methyltransferase domain-containing protein [Bacteroidota bacterium]
MELSSYKQSIIDTFNRASAKYNEIGTPFFTNFGEKLVEYAGIQADDKILDLACGKGATVLPAFHHLGPEGSIIGIDLAQEMIDYCRYEYLALQQAHFMVMDAENLVFPDNAFDKVICSFALFFFENLKATLQGIDRVLRSPGTFVFSTWAKQYHFEWLVEKMQEYLTDEPTISDVHNKNEETVNFYSKEGLQNLIEKAGWKCKEIYTEQLDCYYKNENEFIQMWHNSGVGIFLSKLKPAEYGRFKEEVYEMLQRYKRENQLVLDYSALIAVAEK